MARSLLALGSNLGERDQILAQACSAIAKLPGCQLLARSTWHGTIPIGGADDQGEFLNGAVLLETRLPPDQLVDALLNIESQLGRQRVVRWDARTLDIDVLLYDQQVVDSDDLVIPHPRMSFRRFVLEPAAEIAGDMLHPTSGWTIAGLLAHVRKSPRFVVVTAPEYSLARWLTVQLSERLACQIIDERQATSATTDVLPPAGGIEFPNSECGKPPTVAVASPAQLVEAVTSCDQVVHPAVVIWIDGLQADRIEKETALANTNTANDSWPTTSTKLDCQGLGPLARITADDPATVLQEAEATLRSIWPDLK